jgi:3-dehydroquinate synthase
MADERETAEEDGRALLNLGHTFGHAIENVAGYGTYLHGEAVAIGLMGAAELSQHLNLLKHDEVQRISYVLQDHQLPIRLMTPLPLNELLRAMAKDKKQRTGQPWRFVTLRGLGYATTEVPHFLKDNPDPKHWAQVSLQAIGAV